MNKCINCIYMYVEIGSDSVATRCRRIREQVEPLVNRKCQYFSYTEFSGNTLVRLDFNQLNNEGNLHE
jgi:hypothetical protein